jgi:hypothetical protein
MNRSRSVSTLGLVAIFYAASLAGCGGGDDSGGVDGFVGTWNYSSGTSTTNCGGQSETDMLTGGVTLSKGVSSPLVSLSDGCNLLLDVTGSTATARPGQECSMTKNGVNATAKFTAYSFTINGIVADESGSGTLMASGAGGSVNCTVTSSGKLTKVSK